MDSAQDIMSRLKFIGRIKVGEKMNTRGIFVQPDHIITSFSRTFWNKDNRKNTYEYLSDTKNQTYALLEQLSKTTSNPSMTKITMENILKDLREAKIGINNLRKTYDDDVKFICDIDTLLQDIDSYLKQYTPDSIIQKSEVLPITEIQPNAGNHVNIAVSTSTGTIDVKRTQPVSIQPSQHTTQSVNQPILKPSSYPAIQQSVNAFIGEQTTPQSEQPRATEIVLSRPPSPIPVHPKYDESY